MACPKRHCDTASRVAGAQAGGDSQKGLPHRLSHRNPNPKIIPLFSPPLLYSGALPIPPFFNLSVLRRAGLRIVSMAALAEALKSLSPTSVDSLPREDDLEGYLANSLRDARIIVSSLPQGGEGAPTAPGGVEELQKEWRPVTLSAKENPLGIQVFKLQPGDGKGAWFARRSVHAGIEFRRFRAALEREFQQGDGKGIKEERGNVRGIGRERQVETRRYELGQIEVNYLSAQFPGPSAPRDFVTACLTSSASLEDLSQPGQPRGGPPSRSRQFTMVSRPLIDHPECAERRGYVRGQYESVEFIRETPAQRNPHIDLRDGCALPVMKRVRSVPNLPEDKGRDDREGRKRGQTITFADGPEQGGHREYTPGGSLAGADMPVETLEDNPVEWIMISRSDPGGSVPRWMVERGTPGSIVRDAEKFLDWAGKHEDLANYYLEEEEAGEACAGAGIGESNKLREGAIPGQQRHEESKQDTGATDPDSRREDPATGHGLISSAINTLSAGVASGVPSVIYTPSTTATSTPAPSGTPTKLTGSTSDNDASDDGFDTTSLNTFTTAISIGSYTGNIYPPSSSASSVHTTSATTASRHHPHTTHEEKALNRLLREKSKLSAKLAKQMEKEERKRSKDGEKEKKLLEKHLKEVEKREDRYRKDIEKAKRRVEKRERKEGRDRREIGELKKIVEGLTRENLDLRARVEELERKERGASGERASLDGAVGYKA
ncbi:unnamed protein product [Tuber aestivum]|uniref:DUF3074 domain-containing protein n=1 Tax=Tuber aestivum TaxID=59557 RepID=A0A292PVL8_9PEZI|nr:unnamed protein product [Tuber aestivum]